MTYDEIVASLTGPGGAFELVTEMVGGHPVRNYRDAPRSMRAMLEGSRAYGDKPFICFQDEVLSFAEHYRQVSALAHHLRAAGVGRGDHVAVGMRNYPEWAVAFWACQAIGAVVVALNGWWTAPELEYAIEDSGACAMIVDGEIAGRLRAYIAGRSFRTLVLVRAEGGELLGTSLAQITAPGTGADGLPDAELDRSDRATILYTSGTTGKPKGAIHTHGNHIATMMNVKLIGAIRAEMEGRSTPVEPVSMQTHPIFHIGGMGNMYLSTTFGIKLVLMYKWDAAEADRLVREHRPTMVTGVPIQMRQLLEHARETGTDLSSIGNITTGGAPVPPDLVDQIGAIGAMPWNGYGLTETTGAFICNVGQEYMDHKDSAGRPIPSCEVRIVGEDDRACAPGEVGEVLARGPNVIPGYWNRPEDSAAAFRDGWFHTGDMGFLSETGLCYLVDRKKDVIIRGGENIYSVEVESEIFAIEGVSDVAVFGVPDAQYGEQVCALVRVGDAHLHDGFVSAMRDRLAGRLARFKLPATIHLTVEELPRNAGGKILKRELRDRFAEPQGAA